MINLTDTVGRLTWGVFRVFLKELFLFCPGGFVLAAVFLAVGVTDYANKNETADEILKNSHRDDCFFMHDQG